MDAVVSEALRACTTDPKSGEAALQAAASQDGEAFAISLCNIACCGDVDLR